MKDQNLFAHRFNTENAGSHAELADSILNAANRAIGILVLLSFQFDGEDRDMPANHIIEKSLDAIRAEVDDIKQIVTAYHSERLQESKDIGVVESTRKERT